jgi:hypothetical protein
MGEAKVVPSRRTHGYYRKVIVPAIREYCGHESDAEAHVALKAGFYKMAMADPQLPSMADMSQEEATRFIDWALRQAAEASLVLPDPKRMAVSDAPEGIEW